MNNKPSFERDTLTLRRWLRGHSVMHDELLWEVELLLEHLKGAQKGGYAYALGDRSKVLTPLERLLIFCPVNDTVTRSELYSKIFQRNRTAAYIREFMQDLTDQGMFEVCNMFRKNDQAGWRRVK